MASAALANDPMVDTVSLPRFDELGADRIGPALDALLAEHRRTVAAIVAERPASFADAWMPLERVDVALDALWASVSHLHAVADTPALRDAHAHGLQLLTENHLAVTQNRDLFDVLGVMHASADFADAPAADRAAVTRALRDFRLAGVELSPDDQARFRRAQVELSELGSAFASAVMDATEAWCELIEDEAGLAGLSAADKAMFAGAARSKGLQGWLVTLHQPSVSAILRFAEDRDLRFRVYQASSTRASDQGPNAGRFDNSERIARTLALRREAAALLGFADPVAQSLATKIAPDADAVLGFLRDLAARAGPFAQAEISALRLFAAERLGITDLEPWDIAFASDRLRQERHAIDEDEVRAYFPVDRVFEGWKALLRALFGIRLTDRSDVPSWHEDVRFFDAIGEDGQVFAGLYVDLHARDGKRGGAWMASARDRIRDGERNGVPVAFLTCNFPPPGDASPSLLSHDDVTTLLHETGHCLHHLFTEIDRPSVGGISGFEWDAVELPSQLMEDFAWDAGVLADMSGHHETGEPLPPALFGKLLGARRFQAGMALVRQIEFALFDLLLHLGTYGDDPDQVLALVRKEVAVVHPPHWHRFAHSFTHIFAGSYAAGYYSYLWAEVLAADGFARFADNGLTNRSIGDVLRAEVLARGSVRSAAESFRAFRGRDPDQGAMLRRRGLTEKRELNASNRVGGNDHA